MLLMTELLICEVMMAVENRNSINIDAAAQRCRDHLPQHPESDQRLRDRLHYLAMEYGAEVALV